MRTVKKAAAILSLFFLLAALAACGSKEDTAYGKITKINDTEITIETGTYEEPSQKPSGTEGETPPAKPDGDTGSSDQQPPEGESGQGDKEPPSGEPPEGIGGFTSDGEEATYLLSDKIDITNLKEGLLVKLTLEEDTVTAIETIQQPEPPSETDSEEATAKTSAAYTIDGKEQTTQNKDYSVDKSNVSAVLVENKGNLTLSGGTLTKSGDTTSDNDSNFYGLNAVLTASGGSKVALDGITLTSSGKGANAIFATGENSQITAKNFTIYTTGDSSRGLDATYNGTIIADSGDITTKGSHCAPIATDRGEGTIKVSNTSVSAEGDGSPCVYSTGNIRCTKVTGSATNSQIAVVEGKNKLTLKECVLQGAGKNGIMLYQSTSGDAAEGKAVFKASDSTLTTTSGGPMFYVTNTVASATLKNTTMYYSSGILVNAAGNKTNQWGKVGENGGNFTLTGVNQTLEGDIKCDKISTVSLKLKKQTKFKGAIDAANTAKSISVNLDRSSTWTVTADSYVSVITNKDSKCTNIKSSGHTVYYDADNEANSWLDGKTLSLSGGGKLTPSK